MLLAADSPSRLIHKIPLKNKIKIKNKEYIIYNYSYNDKLRPLTFSPSG